MGSHSVSINLIPNLLILIVFFLINERISLCHTRRIENDLLDSFLPRKMFHHIVDFVQFYQEDLSGLEKNSATWDKFVLVQH